MSSFFFLAILLYIGVPVLIIWFIVRIVLGRLRRKNKLSTSQANWYLQLSTSREDTVSQWFFLLGFFFLGVTILAFNRDFGSHISWRLILMVCSVLCLLAAYKFKLIFNVLFGVIGILAWWTTQTAQFVINNESRPVVILSGLILFFLTCFTLGFCHEKSLKFKRVSMIYFVLGIIGISVLLFTLSTQVGLNILDTISEGSPRFTAGAIMLGLMGAGLLISLTYALLYKLIPIFETAAVFLLTLLSMAFLLLPDNSIFFHASSYSYYFSGNTLTATGIIWAVVLNILVFLDVLAVIFFGFRRKEGWLINLGALMLFLLILIKYFDWFFTFLDKSIFFIGAGVLLFLIGWLMERGRRIMLASIKSDETKSGFNHEQIT